jgi:alpha-tubulin suppressor-like RCC1 family protein
MILVSLLCARGTSTALTVHPPLPPPTETQGQYEEFLAISKDFFEKESERFKEKESTFAKSAMQKVVKTWHIRREFNTASREDDRIKRNKEALWRELAVEEEQLRNGLLEEFQKANTTFATNCEHAESLRSRMADACDEEDFETAAKLKDQAEAERATAKVGFKVQLTTKIADTQEKIAALHTGAAAENAGYEQRLREVGLLALSKQVNELEFELSSLKQQNYQLVEFGEQTEDMLKLAVAKSAKTEEFETAHQLKQNRIATTEALVRLKRMMRAGMGDGYAWGSDAFGQLGNDGKVAGLLPGPSVGQWQAPSWGKPSVVEGLGDMDVMAISAGGFHSVALTTQGELFVWGSNKDGQLGIEVGAERDRAELLANDGDEDPDEMDFGEADLASGASSVGQSESGNNASDPAKIVPTDVWKSVYACSQQRYGLKPLHKQTIMDAKFTALRCVAAGERHSLGLNAAGDVVAWGSTEHGLQGSGEWVANESCFRSDNTEADPSRRSWPTQVFPLVGETVTRVSAGGAHTLCVTAEGSVYAWGSNRYGQLGLGPDDSLASRNSPQRIAFDFQQAIKAGAAMAAASGGALALGARGRADGDGGALDVACISAGNNHSAIVVNKHVGGEVVGSDVFMWGRNNCAQLGLGYEKEHLPVVEDKFEPCRTSLVLSRGSGGNGGDASARGSSARVTDVSCGHNHTVALSADGRVYAWGLDNDEMLGVGMGHSIKAAGASGSNDVVLPLPSLVLLPKEVRRVMVVDAGCDHTACTSDAGMVYVWGAPLADSVGEETPGESGVIKEPTLVPRLDGLVIASLSVGGGHVLVASAPLC